MSVQNTIVVYKIEVNKNEREKCDASCTYPGINVNFLILVL
jgi:hypothetical protein